jgi:hypothetical protein
MCIELSIVKKELSPAMDKALYLLLEAPDLVAPPADAL